MWGDLSESKVPRKVVPGTAPPEIKLKMLLFFLFEIRFLIGTFPFRRLGKRKFMPFYTSVPDAVNTCFGLGRHSCNCHALSKQPKP